MNGHNRHRCAGMAIIIAIAMTAMVGIALLALATRLATEAKMTRYAAQDAQVRQLMLASAATALHELNQTEPPKRGQPQAVQTPADPNGDATSLVLRFEPIDADESQRVLVDARVGKRHSRQLLRFELQKTKWQLVEADPNH